MFFGISGSETRLTQSIVAEIFCQISAIITNIVDVDDHSPQKCRARIKHRPNEPGVGSTQIVSYGLGAWAIPWFVRGDGLSIARAGLLLGTIGLVAGALGSLAGGAE